MPTLIEKQLNETLRDALVSYYLSEVVPKDDVLTGKLLTANDLYEYLLLDVQVSQEIQTSKVASAIGSIQQYINGIILGMEPGYDTRGLEAQTVTTWKDQQSQYPIWAANQQLAWYPEIYIDPSLRLKKSQYFRQLEDDINQNRISVDTTQEAVKSYLAKFEEIANLTLINGYVDSDNFAEGTYYFIGKSRAENTFYWRSVNMSERVFKTIGDTTGPKFDHPTPGAWSDWKRANLPISDSTLERTIRPVYFNNRLFVAWVDAMRLELDPLGDNGKSQTTLRLNMAYKKYDDSWSVPQTYIEAVVPGDKAQVVEELDTIAVYEPAASPKTLFMSMYAGYKKGATPVEDTYSFIKAATLDRNFNVSPVKLGPDISIDLADKTPHFMLLARLFADTNKGRLQFSMPGSEPEIFIVPTPTGPDTLQWDYGGFQKNITDLSDSTIIYDKDFSSFFVFSTIQTAFASPPAVDSITLELNHITQGESYKLTLMFPKEYIPDNGFTVLTAGSTFEVIETKIHHLAPNTVELYLHNYNGEGVSYGFLFDTPMGHPDSGSLRLSQMGPKEKMELQGAKINNKALRLLTASKTVHGLSITREKLQSTVFMGSQFSMEYFTPPELRFSRQISRPLSMSTPGNGSTSPLYTDNPYPLQYPPSPLAHYIPVDSTTHLPHWDTEFPKSEFYLIDGVRIEGSLPSGGWSELGHARKLTKIVIGEKLSDVTPIAPKLGSLANASLGIAEYIDFTDSSIKDSDDGLKLRAPIRMNTLFAKELINKANIALENLLSWSTQQLEEPAMAGGPGGGPKDNRMDFRGANSLYFWELFLHLPFMIAHRLNLERQFDKSEYWLSFIFEPAQKAANHDDGRPDYWNVRPLIPTQSDSADAAINGPLDPDGIASSHPIRYQKAIHAFYVKNLIDRGDAAYRQLTPDSLGEAKLWYMRALSLLGPRPDPRIISRWTPMTLGTLGADTNINLRAFEQQLIEQDRRLSQDLIANDGRATLSFDTSTSLRLRPFAEDPTLPEVDNPHLRAPMNAKLVANWDTLESRLNNLRNNRTLDGKALSLPLFAAPLDPRAMLAAHVQGADSDGNTWLLAQDTPHYRFTVMHSRANAAVDTLSQFGNTLLSLIERKDNAALMEQQYQQAWDLAQFAIDLQTQTQKTEAEGRKALLASQAIADARANFYAALADQRVSPGETQAAAKFMSGRTGEQIAALSSAAGKLLKIAPNLFGLANGGHRLEGVPESVSIIAKTMAVMDNAAGTALDRTEGLRRRSEEWEHQRDQARLESALIDAQLKVHDEQTALTSLQLTQAQTALTHAKSNYEFLGKSFTASQLYQWLQGQFATFYYQAYDATLSLCLAAEACWQFEMADFSTRFIQPGAWKDAYRGLTAGESLKLNLLKMEAAYLARHSRLLEITKTISVRQLLGKQDPVDSEVEIAWPAFVAGLMAGEPGASMIELPQALFDADYPGHYLRRIMRMSVSLPVTVGPYQDIRATLTQTYNAVAMAPSIDAVNYLKNPAEGAATGVRENLRASQEIAISSGLDDDGLFTFNFGDERYLPFEGTGAVSKWALEFPTLGTENDERQHMLESLTDVILHVRYTASNGGAGFADEVRASYRAPNTATKTIRKERK
jgi:Tc toxin complex TcA C-terminal TcB-binding domain/Neuraminidase-like domain